MDRVMLVTVIMMFLSLAGILVISYYDTNAMTNATSEVFSSITNTTTNKEIVEQIHESCGKFPWYTFKYDCEERLLRMFIKPTRT